MDGSRIRALAESWIKMHHSSKNSSEYNDNFWAFEQLHYLCDSEPELCFEVIEQIRHLDNSDIVLANLAAGPLEDLLAEHGECFIDRIEKLARIDSQVRKILGAVWRSTISESIWKRIQVVADPSW